MFKYLRRIKRKIIARILRKCHHTRYWRWLNFRKNFYINYVKEKYPDITLDVDICEKGYTFERTTIGVTLPNIMLEFSGDPWDACRIHFEIYKKLDKPVKIEITGAFGYTKNYQICVYDYKCSTYNKELVYRILDEVIDMYRTYDNIEDGQFESDLHVRLNLLKVS